MYRDIDRKIGQNIRKLRKERKLTQDKFVAKLQLAGFDISRNNYAKIEVGLRYIYPAEMIILKKTLNCTYDEIFKVE